MKNQNYASDTAQTMMSRSTRRARAKVPLISVGVLLTLCCLVAVGGAAVYYFFSSGEAGTIVLIHAPQNGESLEVGQTATVRAVASDPNKVTRVELWADGQLIEAETSNVSGGISSFPLLSDWTPSTTGRHTLMVRAFNSRGARAHSTVYVDANLVPDRDNDGVADEVDLCPEQPGLDVSNGCPDRDHDGVPDANDSCPDVAGLPASGGCPAASAEDRDGDGTPDAADICPDVPGSSLVEGCPDSDGDLVADAEDLCPTESGSPESGGCSAADMADDDVVPADEGGIPSGGGTSDRDGDGASDDVDPCPTEAGLPENDFCPPPAEDPAPAGDGPLLEIPGFFFGEVIVPAFVEFEALHFEVPLDYRRVWCYTQLAGGEVARYEFLPGEERSWNIAEVLGGGNSVHLAVRRDEPLDVFAECYGVYSIFAPRTYYLGSITRQHAPEEWDGHVIQVDSTGGEPGGHGFKVRYHLCSPTCEATALQPPVITRFTTDGDRIHLYWDWEGDIRTIEGFKLYLNGNFIEAFPREERDTTWRQSSTFCVDEWEFYMTTYGGPSAHTPDIESAPGNSIIWDSVPCQKQIRVTFQTMDLHNPPLDQGGGHNPGPITGSFVASAGAHMETLNFGAVRCYHFPLPPFEACAGVRLSSGEYSVQALFDHIQHEHDACVPGLPCPTRSFHAPTTDTVTIGVNPGDDLTVGARIIDVDAALPNDTLYNDQITVDTSTLSPETPEVITIPGGIMDIVVKVDLFPFNP